MIALENDLKEELEGLKRKNLLNPKDMLEFAMNNTDSALHGKLEWDYKKAHQEYNLWICREIIASFKWSYTTQDKEVIQTRRWVSLEEDRHNDGGYREIEDVMNNKLMRAKLLEKAKQDFQSWKTRFIVLEKELKPVFDAMDKVK